ncbi:MAG TPA: cobalamin biosynthesis protein [Stellaceae bacterium]|nr:cobalamin biosynthesis protein [Stellaceae bacterium]
MREVPALAIGVGCRPGCSADEIIALIETSIALAGRPGHRLAGLFTSADRGREAGLIEAARRLGCGLVGFAHARLMAEQDRLDSPSATVLRAIGVPSVAEAAALAASGPDGILVVPKLRSAAVTCAIALMERPS